MRNPLLCMYEMILIGILLLGHESSSLHNQTEEIESRSLDDSVFGMMNDMDNVILEDIRRKHVIGGTLFLYIYIYMCLNLSLFIIFYLRNQNLKLSFF